MQTTVNTTAQIFITDYKSYNEGKQFTAGQWYDLSEYSATDDLIEAVKNHYESVGEESDDLELMITDSEGLPEALYSEAFDDNAISQAIQFAGMDEGQKEILTAFINCFGGDFAQALENYEDAYQGEYKDDEDFAYDMAEQCGYETPSGWPYNCIDWSRAARDLMFDYSESNGHYFHSNW